MSSAKPELNGEYQFLDCAEGSSPKCCSRWERSDGTGLFHGEGPNDDACIDGGDGGYWSFRQSWSSESWGDNIAEFRGWPDVPPAWYENWDSAGQLQAGEIVCHGQDLSDVAS